VFIVSHFFSIVFVLAQNLHSILDDFLSERFRENCFPAQANFESDYAHLIGELVGLNLWSTIDLHAVHQDDVSMQFA
jgi:hypothetical protein